MGLTTVQRYCAACDGDSNSSGTTVFPARMGRDFHIVKLSGDVEHEPKPEFPSLARDVIYTSHAYATMSVSVCLSVTEVHWVAMNAGNTAAVPASKVEAIIRSPTNMATADGGVISR